MISSATYSRRLATIWLDRHWWLIVIPVAACLIAGMYDWRWLVIAFALLLIVWPGILMIVYFRYALTPEARKAILDKTVVKNPDGSLSITYLPPTDPDAPAPPAPEHIPATAIRRVEYTGKSTIYYLKSSPYHFIESQDTDANTKFRVPTS